MTEDLYARLAQNLLDARIQHTLAIGQIVITYRIDISRSTKSRKPIEEIDAKLTEIFTKNPSPSLGLLEGLYGIRILKAGSTAVPQVEETDDFASEFAEKRLMCNDEELESWVLQNIKQFPPEAQDRIISYHFEKALLKKAKQSKRQGE